MSESNRQLLANIRVIVDHPEKAGNVGSIARAMSNFGLSDLVVAGDRPFNTPEGRRMAMRGLDILLGAGRAATFEEAAAGCIHLIGTTPRAHDSWDITTPRQRAPHWLALAQKGKVGILLGNEVTGLSNEHLSRCTEVCAIPTLGSSSLNIAQAGLVLFYELALAADAESAIPKIEREPAPLGEMEKFYEHLQRFLMGVAYLFPSNPEHVMDSVRHIMRRAEPDRRDVGILHSMIGKFEYRLEQCDPLYPGRARKAAPAIRKSAPPES